MNKFAKLSMSLKESSAQKYLINTPTGRLLRGALLFWLILTTLLAVTFNALVAIVTVPLTIIWIYFYYLFGMIWKRYMFSTFYLVLVPILSVVFAVSIRVGISFLR